MPRRSHARKGTGASNSYLAPSALNSATLYIAGHRIGYSIAYIAVRLVLLYLFSVQSCKC
jgi:hypothetical protein